MTNLKFNIVNSDTKIISFSHHHVFNVRSFTQYAICNKTGTVRVNSTDQSHTSNTYLIPPHNMFILYSMKAFIWKEKVLSPPVCEENF